MTCGKGTRVRSRQILSRTPTAKCKTMPMKEEVVCNIIDCDKKSRESMIQFLISLNILLTINYLKVFVVYLWTVASVDK